MPAQDNVRIAPADGKLGVLIPGMGAVTTTFIAGVEAVKRVSTENRGTALSVYTVFADVSFFMVGPAAGAVIGAFGYASVFLFALACVVAALGIAFVLRERGSLLLSRL